MKKITIAALSVLLMSTTAFTQLIELPEGGNKMALVGERVGITDVLINYNRPKLKGREGKVWGQLVHKGFEDLHFGTSKSAPWRAGANENTTISFSTRVKIQGQEVPAGKYGLFIAYDSLESTLILSKNSNSWGSYFYDDKEDALRVKIKPVATTELTEWLTYEFLDETDTSATIALKWEKLMFPFTISTEYIALQLESFRKELRTEKSFNPGWASYMQAANFCANHNTNLEEGLAWAETSVSGLYVGVKNFRTLSTKSQVLRKLGRVAEADTLMKQALPYAELQELHNYARQMLQQNKKQEAFDAFKLNYDKHPNVFTTNIGLARGYAALGNNKKAAEFAQKALPQAPDKVNKDSVENMLKLLRQGKSIN